MKISDHRARLRENLDGGRDICQDDDLAVVRNLVSALRLLDVVGLFVDDPRVRIHWTIIPRPKFAAETDE